MTDLRSRRSTEGWQTGSRAEGGGYVATVLLAIVLALFGVAILGGGIWLITLGGSWYYAVAGLGLCVTAWFLLNASMMALWVYLATYAFTVVWALWEKGLEPWAQVPRLVDPAGAARAPAVDPSRGYCGLTGGAFSPARAFPAQKGQPNGPIRQ